MIKIYFSLVSKPLFKDNIPEHNYYPEVYDLLCSELNIKSIECHAFSIELTFTYHTNGTYVDKNISEIIL
jgi:hypothetical protein